MGREAGTGVSKDWAYQRRWVGVCVGGWVCVFVSWVSALSKW